MTSFDVISWPKLNTYIEKTESLKKVGINKGITQLKESEKNAHKNSW